MALELSDNDSAPATAVNTLVKGYLTKSVAGASDVTLSDAEARNAIIEFTGALTGNISVIVPAESKVYHWYNNTAGSFTLTLKTSAGTGPTLTQSTKGTAICDGTDVVEW